LNRGSNRSCGKGTSQHPINEVAEAEVTAGDEAVVEAEAVGAEA